mmetsp:Transcript_42085/g.99772  ORF Transcript_42085/g.99772 Transcript_42085/m.99772 type:complete len:235 (+) Transcript_42085:293-997(+)
MQRTAAETGPGKGGRRVGRDLHRPKRCLRLQWDLSIRSGVRRKGISNVPTRARGQAPRPSSKDSPQGEAPLPPFPQGGALLTLSSFFFTSIIIRVFFSFLSLFPFFFFIHPLFFFGREGAFRHCRSCHCSHLPPPLPSSCLSSRALPIAGERPRSPEASRPGQNVRCPIPLALSPSQLALFCPVAPPCQQPLLDMLPPHHRERQKENTGLFSPNSCPYPSSPFPSLPAAAAGIG